MSDVVVTVPKGLWAEWCDEGDAALGGSFPLQPAPWRGECEYGFNLYGPLPSIVPGDRVYIVAHGNLRGYAPLVTVEFDARRFGGKPGGFSLVRRGDAVAVTIPEYIRGFQGWRYRWWDRADEVSFPDWRRP